MTPETGLTLAFTYRPTQDLHYVQLLSFGKESYAANSQKDHFYIGATFHETYRDSDMRNHLVFEWRYGEVSKIITWPQGLAFSAGTTYDVVISISAAEGVVYTVNGVKYNTRYYAGTKADVNTFLNAVPGYQYGYIGRSRWTGDTSFGGDMKDLRLYKTSAQPSRLLGRFFSTDNVWYDAVTNDGSGLVWKAGDYPSYNGSSGYTYFGNPAYVAIRERPIFSSVNADTGVTFAFVYQPTKDKQYNQLLSFGYNEYNTGDARKRHIYVGATYHGTLGGNVPLYMDWMDGVETRTCPKCGETETRAIPASNAAHEWGAWNVTKEPTCAEAGEKTRTCAVCGKTEKKAVDKLAHDWGEWIDDEGSAVTCTTGGTQHRECANCGEIEMRTLPGGFGHEVEYPNLRGEGYCKYCGEFICDRCADMTQYEGLDIIGVFFRIVHFFIHFAHMISYNS